MAELTKPQYHSKSSYPSSRSSVYNVTPAQEKYRGPDENAGQVDLSTAKIFEEIQDGLGLFTELYAQSEKTANVLQAKGLLMDKMKDTQRITELLDTELPNTGYEHLKLKNVLDKYRTTDPEGRTDLNLGKDLEHNISALQMPNDINDHVRSMIEDDWLKMDVDIIKYLTSEVNEVQNKQTLAYMSQYESQFKGKILNTYLTIKDEDQADKEAQILQDAIDGQVEELGNIGTWERSQMRDQKLKNGQIRLAAKFMAGYLNIEGDPQTNRDDSLKRALNGQYKYTDKEGNEITLNPNHWEPYLLTEMKRTFTEEVTERKNNEIKSENLAFDKYLYKIWRITEGEFDFRKEVTAMVMNPNFKHIEPAVFYRAIFKEEVSRIRRAEIKAKELDRISYTESERKKRAAEADIKATMLADLQNKMVIIGMEFESNPDGATRKYGKKNNEGRWVGKDDDVLQTMKGIENKYARAHYISSFIARANAIEKREIKIENKEIIDAQQTEILGIFRSKATADLLGASTVLYTFGYKRTLPNGEDRYEIDYSKLGSINTIGGSVLIPYGVGINGGLNADRSNRQIQTVQAQLIQPIFDLARRQFKIFMRIDEKNKEEWDRYDIDDWKERITTTYLKNVETRMRYGEGYPEGTVGPDGGLVSVRQRTYDEAIGSYPKGKPPPEDVQVYFNALRDTLERTATIAEKYDEYTLPDLETHRKNLLSATYVPGPFKQQHLQMLKRIIPLFDERKIQLILHPVETGFKEGEVVREDGTYDIQKYYDWQVKFGVEDMSNLVFKSTLTNIEKVTEQPSIEASKDFMTGMLVEVNKYGTTDSMNRLMAFEQMLESFPYGWKIIFQKMYSTGQLPDKILLKAEWLKANNPDYGKKRIPKRP